MEYSQNDMLNYYITGCGNPVYKIAFQYTAEKKENKAALNFHLTKREEMNILSAVDSERNQKGFQRVVELFNRKTNFELLKVE